MTRRFKSLGNTVKESAASKRKRQQTDIVRTDRYLWAIRLFKTRSLAAKECQAGKVKRLGHALKPATVLKVGDLLEVPAADGSHKRHIEVVELLQKRVAAPIAQAAYIDRTPAEVLQEAAERRENNRQAREHRKEGDQGRLTKKRRRLWEGRDAF